MKFKTFLLAAISGGLCFIGVRALLSSIPAFQAMANEVSTTFYLAFYSVVIAGVNMEMWNECEYHVMNGDTSLIGLFIKTLLLYAILDVSLAHLAPYLLEVSKHAEGNARFYYMIGGMGSMFAAVFVVPGVVRFILLTPMRDRAVRSHFKVSNIKPSVPKLPSGGGKKRRD